MDPVRWEDRPELARPVLIAAFEGWNDAADAASSACRFLATAWQARRFATLDPEEFYDFTEVRPRITLEDGITRKVQWPTNELQWAHVEGAGRDAVFLHGIEPQLRWRTFSEAITEVAAGFGCDLVITLGSLVSSVPHTREVPITGTAADPALAARLGLQRSQYEGPTGIVGILHDACKRAGIESASLWAAVPHYIAQTPSPKASLALVERAASLIGATVDAEELRAASRVYVDEVNALVAENEEALEYVRSLERSADEEAEEVGVGEGTPLEFKGGDALAAEAERFLRDQRGE